MRPDKPDIEKLTDGELDDLVLNAYPYPIAFNYGRLMALVEWESLTRKSLEVFEYCVRLVALEILSQYLIRDLHQVHNPDLDQKLFRQLPQASLGQWVEFMFLGLETYHGKRDKLFIRELHDIYWATPQVTALKKRGAREAFDQLVQIRNRLAHRLPPRDRASWEELGKKTLTYLRKVLRQFSFLSSYDLVRIVGKQGENYVYESYKGQKITLKYDVLDLTNEEFRIGWFYVARKDRHVMRLHPLLIFWQSPGEAEARDAALYDRFLRESVEYVALVLQEMIEERDIEKVSMIRDLIHYNLEKIKLSRRRTLLSWDGLLSATKSLTDEQIETVKEKFQADLYLQRELLLTKFREFLSSNKSCFVITGKSGVGKSNFVLSLRGEFEASNDVALVMYNAARLNILDTALSKLSQDLSTYLSSDTGSPADIFKVLSDQGSLHRKTLLVIYDALNENVRARETLRKIDQLIGERGHPWLKIVITSRPEAWNRLARDLPLADGYYYREDIQNELLTQELEIGVKLQPFGIKELMSAYAKYREKYKLQTEFGKLRPGLVRALQDPLMLRLVSETYANQTIPEDFRESDIYELYLRTLIKTKRLNDKDLILLEKELMPLMLYEGHYENKITTEQIRNTETSDAKPLWELIYNDDSLSRDERVNDSFIRLIDSEILIGQGTVLDYEISFKYERFYDFFAGNRLYEIYEGVTNSIQFFKTMIKESGQKPYLLGIIQRALLQDLKTGKIETIKGLCKVTIAEVRDMAIAVLSEYGEGHLQDAKELLNELLPPDDSSELIYQENINSAWVALTVGGWLMIPEVLIRGAGLSSPELRTETIRQIYLVWSRDRTTGWKILDRIIEKILETAKFGQLALAALRKQLRIDLLESAGWVSIQIWLNNYEEPDIAIELRNRWRPVIAKVLFYRGNNSWQDRTVGWTRDVILSAILDIVVSRMRGFPKRYNPASIFELQEFYSLPDELRDKTHTLCKYLDPAYGDLEQFERLIFELYPTQNGLINQMIGHTLVAQGQTKLEDVLRIVRRVFDLGINSPKPGVISGNMIWVLLTLGQSQEPIDQKTFETLREIINTGADKVREWHSPLGVYANVWFDGYAKLHFMKYGEFRIDAFDEHITTLIKNNDVLAMTDLLYIVSRLVTTPYWKVTLEVISYMTFVEDTGIRNQIIDILARVRARYKDYVDDYLIRHFRESEIRQRVMVRKAEENIFVTLGPWVEHMVKILHSPAFLNDLLWIADTATKSRKFSHVLKSLTKWGINKIYGEPIFSLH